VAEHEGAGRYPEPIVRELAELGVLGALVGPAAGGLGLDAGTAAMIVEELARGWTTVAATVAGHLVVSAALDRAPALPEQRDLLPALARGEALGAAVFGAGVRARREGDALRLDGTTALVDNAPRAALFLVEAAAADGRALALVLPRATPGLRVGAPEAPLGGRGLDPAPLALEGVRVPASAALDAGAAAAARALASLLAAATGVGLAQAAFEAALRYSQQRSTFGQPLCQHQAVQLKLADMATGTTAARLLLLHAAGAGDPEPVEPARAAMARLLASEVAARATLESMRIHGGYGYVSEFPIERYYRDAARLAFVPVDDETLRRDLARALAARA
jgi:alkylation response protein AidB-like acyl-CoA dehydrogenase